MDLGIDVSDRDGVCVVTVDGEVDVYTSPGLKSRLAELIDDGCEKLIVDLGGVGFMDSSGLGALVSGLRRVKEKEGAMAVVGLREPIHKVFRITGFDKAFPVFDDVDGARDYLS
jgi:anti-sigma B factor antagonist